MEGSIRKTSEQTEGYIEAWQKRTKDFDQVIKFPILLYSQLMEKHTKQMISKVSLYCFILCAGHGDLIVASSWVSCERIMTNMKREAYRLL
jgi:hypothetical protein